MKSEADSLTDGLKKLGRPYLCPKDEVIELSMSAVISNADGEKDFPLIVVTFPLHLQEKRTVVGGGETEAINTLGNSLAQEFRL